MKKNKTYYYNDEINDDFSGFKRNKKIIGDNYKYINNNIIWRFLAVIAYRIIMLPVAFFYLKIKFGLKIENRKILKNYRKGGFFLYGNHTQTPGDAFIEALISFPKKSYVIVSPDNVALKGTEQFMLMLGAMPLPNTVGGYKNFLSALNTICAQQKSVVIFPEAHVWPYYTGIRNFAATSFSYPVKFKKPVFCFTTIYKKRKFRKTPKIIVKIDGPFLSDDTLSIKEAEKKLRDSVYNSMVKASKESDCEYIKYIKGQVNLNG